MIDHRRLARVYGLICLSGMIVFMSVGVFRRLSNCLSWELFRLNAELAAGVVLVCFLTSALRAVRQWATSVCSSTRATIAVMFLVAAGLSALFAVVLWVPTRASPLTGLVANLPYAVSLPVAVSGVLCAWHSLCRDSKWLGR